MRHFYFGVHLPEYGKLRAIILLVELSFGLNVRSNGAESRWALKLKSK